MAKVGAQRAAELTGRSKSTIQRAMNNGKLSFEMDANSRRLVDVSELDRVFGLAPMGGASESNEDSGETELKKAADMIEMERLKSRVKALEDQLDMTREQLEDTKGQRDQWQKQAQQVLLTSQYSQKQAEEFKEELRSRDERAKANRQKVLEERMKRMQGQNENKGRAVKTPSQPADAAAGAPGEAGIDFQGLWQKIKGRTGTGA